MRKSKSQNDSYSKVILHPFYLVRAESKREHNCQKILVHLLVTVTYLAIIACCFAGSNHNSL